MARRIDYGAGFLPQNLYQNLLNIQQQGLAERNRRDLQRARDIGGLAGMVGRMDTGRSAEAEKDFIAKRDAELARMKQGLKNIDPINAPKLYQQQLARINQFEMGSQQAMDRFKDSGFLGFARDRGALQLPDSGRKPEGFDSEGVQQARAKQQQMVGEAQGVRDRAFQQYQDREREVTDRLLDVYDLEEEGPRVGDRAGQGLEINRANINVDAAQDRADIAKGFLQNRERFLRGVQGQGQQVVDEALAQQAKEREGQIYNAGLGIYQDKESFAPIAEYERGFEEAKRKGDITTSVLKKREEEVGKVKKDLKVDEFTALEQAKTDAEVVRAIRMRPQQIETLRQTLKTQRDSDYESWKNLGKEKIRFQNEELVKQTAALGLVKLSEEFKRFGEKFDPVTGLTEDGESIESLKSQKEYNDLVDRLEAQSEVKLDEAENMSAILNAREAGRLQVQLEANINNWEQFGRGQREEIIQQELDKAESLGDIQSLQELENIIMLDPLRQKNALKAYKDRKLADIEAQSGARVREIIQKAGKDITDKQIKTLSELGNTPSEKILLSEFAKASKKAATRQNELNKLSLPDNVISPRSKFEIAKRELNLPADMTYENSQAKLSLITNLINSGETPSEQALRDVGMEGMADEIQKVVAKKQEPFKKEALMNSLVGLVESSVAEGEDGKPDKAKQEEALNAFRALSKDADTKKLLDKYGYDESWFKGQSSVKLRAFTKELASLRQTNSQTALNLAKKSYTESQVPKLTEQQRDNLERSKQFRSAVTEILTEQIKEEGSVDMDSLNPALDALKMQFFPEIAAKEQKKVAVAAVKGLLSRVPDASKEQARNNLNYMSLDLSDEELDEIFNEIKTEEKEEAKPESKEEKTPKPEERAQVTKTTRPPDTQPIGQLYWDISNGLANLMKEGSLGEYLLKD